MKLRNAQKQQDYPVGKVERDQRASGLGEQLKNARENAGLSIQDVANSLKLSPTLVSALENDDYDPLPEPVFVHGYIRNYANIVNLSPDRLLRSYDHGGAPSPHLTVTPTVTTRFQWTDTLVLSAIGLSVLLLLALLTLFFPKVESWWGSEVVSSDLVGSFSALPEQTSGVSSHAFTSTESGVNQVDSLVVDATSEVSGERITLSELAVDESVSGLVVKPGKSLSDESVGLIEKDSEEIVVIDVNEQKAEESTVVEVVEYNLAADLEAKSQLVLESTGDCWASIKDSSGGSVFDGVLKAGEHHFSGVAPFSLVLGRPENIAKILYDGALVDDKDFRVKRVARFSVGEIINE